MWLGTATVPGALSTFGIVLRLRGAESVPTAKLHLYFADGIPLSRNAHATLDNGVGAERQGRAPAQAYNPRGETTG